MAIDTRPLDRIPALPEPVVDTSRVAKASANAPSVVAAPPSTDEVGAAVKALQAAIDSGPNPSFTLDYLSGLSVVTVRSNVTGEVVYQLPDTRAVELARLIKDGNTLSSLGLLNTEV